MLNFYDTNTTIGLSNIAREKEELEKLKFYPAIDDIRDLLI